MAFSSNVTVDQPRTGSGELGNGPYIAFTADKYQNNLPIGVFVRFDQVTKEIQVLDASADPAIAGVVLRDLGATLDATTYDNTLFPTVDYVHQGLVQVEVVAGQSPDMFGTVTVNNIVGPDAGKALSDGSGEAVNAEFIREVATNVWLIRIY